MGMVGFAIVVGIVALIYAAYTSSKILKKDEGSEKVKEIADAIHHGAMAFLNKEYRILLVFMIVVAAVLWFLIPYNGNKLAISFIVGGILSALAGNIGMGIATKANSRAAVGAKKSISDGLHIAFSSGVVMGLSVVGLGLIGVSALYLVFKDANIIFGFGLGASSIALFARVGGGIFTKAADVGADLVGKVEKGIPEDDPRNPAVIADLVGDNVGDVAGMGADLFESYVDNIIAAMVLGVIAFSLSGLKLPLALSAFGVIASILGTFFVRAANKEHLYSALNKGIFGASVIMLIGSYFIVKYLIDDIGIFYAVVAGLIAGIIIGLSTEYFTSPHRKPAMSIAEASKTGAGTNIIQGISVGMFSTIIPVLAVSAAILIAFKFGGLFGIAIAGVGMLSTLGITLAADTYGPVADNAAGIAEMSGMGTEVRKRAEALDEVGNTTAAIGKGFAIGSAALTALALFASYMEITGLRVIDISEPIVIVGLFIGAMLPYVFTSLTMRSVGKAAYHIINEVRRQFKQIKGLMQGKAKPDYNKCIAISTHAALREMIAPSLIAILTPIAIGYFLGVEALGGLLVGVTVSGFLMAVFLVNAGGAWDNAKKYIEEGHFGGKGSDAHKAAVVGDTVGDPEKDTSGPSMNILIKLMAIVSIVFLPLFL